MGEEEKKPEETKVEEKKPEEAKKIQEEKKEESAEKSAGDKDKKPEEEKKEEVVPPPPPPEIVLKVFMHCEGCARKVRRSLKGFPGVEDVVTDCKFHKVIVKGEKADPLKVLERIQRKSHRQVELLSPIPKPPEEKKKVPEEEKPVLSEQKEEKLPPIVTNLKVHMHCEACSLEIKRRILRMKGVESAEADLKNSLVSVKGVYDPEKLVEYVFKRTGKHAVIVKQEAEKKEKVEEEAKEEKKEEGEKEKKSGEGEEKKEKKEEEAKGESKAAEETAASSEDSNKVVPEVKINEYFYNPSRYGMEVYAYPAHPVHPAHPAYYHAYPPQMFSDENPNACTVM